MKTVTLSATFDGHYIRLNDPYALAFGTRVLVTILPPDFSFGATSGDTPLTSSPLLAAHASPEPRFPTQEEKAH